MLAKRAYLYEGQLGSPTLQNVSKLHHDFLDQDEFIAEMHSATPLYEEVLRQIWYCLFE